MRNKWSFAHALKTPIDFCQKGHDSANFDGFGTKMDKTVVIPAENLPDTHDKTGLGAICICHNFSLGHNDFVLRFYPI